MHSVFRRSPISWAALVGLVLLCGCRSPWVQATVANEQSTPVSLVEVSYPGGSFGVQSIAAHAAFHYRFRILSTGAATIDFNDASGHSHTATGPELQQGQQGTLRIEIGPGSKVMWAPSLAVMR